MDLYISDLDGTLLNSKREISDYSKKTLNNLMREKGLEFTIATARTPGTVIEILEGLNIKKAISLMNGVFLYDLKEKKYMKIRSIKKDTAIKILNVLESFNKASFVYGIRDNHLYVYHKEMELDLDITYHSERKNSLYKTFKVVKNYDQALKDLEVVNFMILDKLEVVEIMYKELSKIDGINCGYYKDVYDESCYFIEIHSGEASKEKAVDDLREMYKPNKVICFGDNMNDLPMFKVADEKYAVKNGVDGIKGFATEIINTNDLDGVVKFIEKRFEK